MRRCDRTKVMARLGWTERKQHQLEATLQGRQNDTALLGMAPVVAAMLADWRQTNWFTVQGAEKRALNFTGVRPGDRTADVMFAFAFARFHRKLVERLRKKGLLCAILQLDASADESEEIHMEPAYMDDFFLPVVSDTAADLLPRVALAAQVVIETAGEHGLQLNMAANKTEVVVDFRGKGRQQVLEELAVRGRSVDANRQGRGGPLAQIGKHASALCEEDGDVIGVVAPFRGVAQVGLHGDQVVELSVLLEVHQERGLEEDGEGQVEVEREEGEVRENRTCVKMGWNEDSKTS